MSPLSYHRHRFRPAVIQHAVWLYLRFTRSYRDVEELFAQRGLDLSYESIRNWVLKFGPLVVRRLRQNRPRPSEQQTVEGDQWLCIIRHQTDLVRPTYVGLHEAAV